MQISGEIMQENRENFIKPLWNISYGMEDDRELSSKDKKSKSEYMKFKRQYIKLSKGRMKGYNELEGRLKQRDP